MASHELIGSWCPSCQQDCLPPAGIVEGSLCPCCDARIRADERERTEQASREVHRLNAELDAAKERTLGWMNRYGAQVEAERQAWADLRERVKALIGDPEATDGQEIAAYVLALLGGESDE